MEDSHQWDGLQDPSIFELEGNRKREIACLCMQSLEVTAKTLFPERFDVEFSPLHRKMFKILDSDAQQVCVAAPRGFGKTTIANIVLAAKAICFRERKFIVPVSCTATQAVMQSENLKHELSTNPAILDLFGPVKPEGISGPLAKFSKEAWVTRGGTIVLPRGAGQQIRGLLYLRHRPDLIIVDDLEDPDEVYSPEQRQKLKNWFFADLHNAVQKFSKNWRIIVIGTVVHEDSLIINLLDNPDWTTLRLELFDDELRSNWPAAYSDEDIKRMVEVAREQGTLDVLFREMRNMPISTIDSAFRSKYFRYYNEEDLRDKDLENVVVVDPAKTVKPHSHDSAIVGASLDYDGGVIYIREVICRKMHPEELYGEALSMCFRLGASVLAVEVTSLNEFITYPLRTEIFQRQAGIELVELKARGKKEERIASLIPFYRKGMIIHNTNGCDLLESQLLAFPRGRTDDAIDAEAYLIELFEQGSRYLTSNELPDDDEYKAISDDPPVSRFDVATGMWM